MDGLGLETAANDSKERGGELAPKVVSPDEDVPDCLRVLEPRHDPGRHHLANHLREHAPVELGSIAVPSTNVLNLLDLVLVSFIKFTNRGQV